MANFERKRNFADLYERFDLTGPQLKCGGRRRCVMYIEPELSRELEEKWIELLWDASEHEGVEPPLKHRDFYPAAIRAVVNGTTVEEELGL